MKMNDKSLETYMLQDTKEWLTLTKQQQDFINNRCKISCQCDASLLKSIITDLEKFGHEHSVVAFYRCEFRVILNQYNFEQFGDKILP